MQEALCDRCRTIDFDEVFGRNEIPATGAEITTLNRVAKSRCRLCHFFYQLGPQYSKKYTLHVRLFDHIRPPSLTYRKGSEEALDIPRQPFLSVIRKNAKLQYDYSVQDEIAQVGVIGYIPNDGPQWSTISMVGSRVDYQSIRGQLERCLNGHSRCSRRVAPAIASQTIFLIDCSQGRIVKRTLEDEYMALSYVWGSRQRWGESSGPRGFSVTDAPLTVRDAVEVVQRLGRRYLWVDRYCINQDDADEKEAVLRIMDLIYERSIATIVALHGDNDQSGLPGVSSIARTPQSSLDTGKGRLISSCPPIPTVLRGSTWNTRGWTYQEARLSRSCIMFTNYQVYCVCRESTWSEAVPLDPECSTLIKLLNTSTLDGPLFGVDSFGGSGLFQDRLQYSKRTFTYDADVLTAFSGILCRSPYVTFWGIPIIPQESGMDPNTGFSLGQLWIKRPSWTIRPHLRPSGTTQTGRRRNFPTWSWTSLVAEIYQDTYGTQSLYGQYIDGMVVDFPHNEAETLFGLYLGGVRVPLCDLRCDETSNSSLEGSRELTVEGDLVLLRYKHRGTAHKWYYLDGVWRYFQPDLHGEDQDWPGKPNADEDEAEEHVLVLIQWNESQKSNMRRLLLMVLKWVDDTHAERMGLLTEYRQEFPVGWVQQLPRTRRRFILQ